MSLSNQKLYEQHKSSFFNMNARTIGIVVMVLVLVMDLIPSAFNLGWLPAAIFMYFEKDSLFVKYHSAQILFVQVAKGFTFLLLTVLAVVTNQPYFTGDLAAGDFSLSLFGYLDVAVILIWFVIWGIQFWNVLTYKEFSLKFVRKLVYRFLSSDPNFGLIYDKTPFEEIETTK